MKQYLHKQLYQSQKGIAAVAILVIAVVLVIIIVAAVFFMLNGQDESAESGGQSQAQTSDRQISDDQVLVRICETGEGEDCNDPVSDEVVDQLEVDDLP